MFLLGEYVVPETVVPHPIDPGRNRLYIPFDVFGFVVTVCVIYLFEQKRVLCDGGKIVLAESGFQIIEIVVSQYRFEFCGSGYSEYQCPFANLQQDLLR
ncbi:hypothetical protein SDC9_152022 [bioreactor metagenome]|uniref:Uncharacterized protein n=1 Tax=bioreactor metagenome TaxID=1076179 RepID=A0A645ERX5_9ZZZZ